VIEGDQLGWTHKGGNERVEEQHHVLAAVMPRPEAFIEAVVRHHCGHGEIRCRWAASTVITFRLISSTRLKRRLPVYMRTYLISVNDTREACKYPLVTPNIIPKRFAD
jgi:hypothetical protein